MRPIRFIPTYMGNATHRIRPCGYRSVHPHVHGERTRIVTVPGHALGSSPRTWGTQYGNHRARYALRFIPTYMGNAYSLGLELIESAVHPHVHGERFGALTVATGPVGSSPRTWGTRGEPRRPGDGGRFIPTYMGNAL